MWSKKLMGIIIALAPMILADPPLVGRWIEDETLRTGLYDFLWARGKLCTQRVTLYENRVGDGSA